MLCFGFVFWPKPSIPKPSTRPKDVEDPSRSGSFIGLAKLQAVRERDQIGRGSVLGAFFLDVFFLFFARGGQRRSAFVFFFETLVWTLWVYDKFHVNGLRKDEFVA